MLVECIATASLGIESRNVAFKIFALFKLVNDTISEYTATHTGPTYSVKSFTNFNFEVSQFLVQI